MLGMKLKESLESGFCGFCLLWQGIEKKELDDDSNFEHMELECPEGISEELFCR